MTSTDHRRQHLLPWQVVFVLLAATWGCSFWWIKLGLQMLAPVQVAFVRLAIGASALVVVSAVVFAAAQSQPAGSPVNAGTPSCSSDRN